MALSRAGQLAASSRDRIDHAVHLLDGGHARQMFGQACGVATSEAAFCSTCPVRASHLNQLRMAASARAAEAFDRPRS